MKPTILVTLGALWPGHESTGPNLSQVALCKALADEFDFRILARDRPWGASAPMVDNRDWHDLGYAKVHYLTVGRFGAQGLWRLLRETPHDLRHTAITRALDQGLSYRQVQMMSGHRDPKTVMRYDHHRENMEHNAVNFLSYEEEEASPQTQPVA